MKFTVRDRAVVLYLVFLGTDTSLYLFIKLIEKFLIEKTGLIHLLSSEFNEHTKDYHFELKEI